MFGVLIFTPIIMIIGDTLLSSLLMAFTNSAPHKLSPTDVSNLESYMFNGGGDYDVFARIGSVTITYVDGSDTLLKLIGDLHINVDEAITTINNSPDDVAYGMLGMYLIDLQTDISNIQAYLQSGLSIDHNSMYNLVFNTWGTNVPENGMFISDDNIKIINTISTNLTNFQGSMLDLQDQLGFLNSDQCKQG
jgi:hypothetical protein